MQEEALKQVGLLAKGIVNLGSQAAINRILAVPLAILLLRHAVSQ